jgi:hypothetical protein
MFTLPKEFPDIGVGESSERCDFEFQEVVLVGVEVDGVDSRWGVECVGEDVVACRGDGEDYIRGREFQEAVVNPGVLPSKGVDELMAELSVLLELVIVVDAPVVVLVEE